jgi:hypothetical protein
MSVSSFTTSIAFRERLLTSVGQTLSELIPHPIPAGVDPRAAPITLLRMADLLAMQPNLNIPLYVVAPDERRDKALVEVNRPTFSRLSPALRDACRFISFSTLRERLPELAPYVQYLKPAVLAELSESGEMEQP